MRRVRAASRPNGRPPDRAPEHIPNTRRALVTAEIVRLGGRTRSRRSTRRSSSLTSSTGCDLGDEVLDGRASTAPAVQTAIGDGEGSTRSTTRWQPRRLGVPPHPHGWSTSAADPRRPGPSIDGDLGRADADSGQPARLTRPLFVAGLFFSDALSRRPLRDRFLGLGLRSRLCRRCLRRLDLRRLDLRRPVFVAVPFGPPPSSQPPSWRAPSWWRPSSCPPSEPLPPSRRPCPSSPRPSRASPSPWPSWSRPCASPAAPRRHHTLRLEAGERRVDAATSCRDRLHSEGTILAESEHLSRAPRRRLPRKRNRT